MINVNFLTYLTHAKNALYRAFLLNKAVSEYQSSLRLIYLSEFDFASLSNSFCRLILALVRSSLIPLRRMRSFLLI